MNIDENVQKNECSCNTENGKKMMEMLETERKRIVSELHDTSLQNIAHLVHMIELASLYIDKDPARAKMELNSVSKGLHNVIEDIRSTIFNLRPMTFDDLGLKASFERLLDFLNADKDYIMDVEIDDVSCETDDYFCITLYRVVQECLLNIKKHSQATRVLFHCKKTEQKYEILIQDNGKGFTMEVLDYLDGDEAGIKSVTFQVNGENAYGYLKSEKGVHRLVRISPFNAAGKRQTSFVSCDVMPDIKKDLDVEINDDDIRIDTYRSSGAGGQHINKTSSAIRITHFPTGIVVQCQNERSQHMNKDKAMQMLKAKLFLLKQQEAEAKLSGIRGEVTDIGWGNQIRSYVMQPYTMVKDHRTSEETGNVDAVLDGEIDPFINAYLKWIALSKKTAEQ